MKKGGGLIVGRIVCWISCFMMPIFSTGQKGIGVHEFRIDTLTKSFKVEGFYSEKAIIPQLKSKSPLPAVKKINQDLQDQFHVYTDSADFVKSYILNYGVKDIEEYFAKDLPIWKNRFTDFEIKYLSENLLSVAIREFVAPNYSSCYCFNYDLRTGCRLSILDFTNINEDDLTALVKESGYELTKNSKQETLKYYSKEKTQIDFDSIVYEGDDEILVHIASLYYDFDWDDGRCGEYYFEKVQDETHLRFAFNCYQNKYYECGINVSFLKDSMIFPEFKNEFRTWGKDIYSLIGGNEIRLDSIVFDDYTARSGGGYLIESKASNDLSRFWVSYWNSDKSRFFLLTKVEGDEFVIKDILEIDKSTIAKNQRIVDQLCCTDKEDQEIIALVNDAQSNTEFYTKIHKAWRANRTKGKFEPFPASKVTKCFNESFGVD